MFATPRSVARPSGLPPKRIWRTKHLVTFFYSSIITTAAWADSSAKRRRRDQLDHAIAHAEDALINSHQAAGGKEIRKLHTGVALRTSTAIATLAVEDETDFLVYSVQTTSSRSSPKFYASESELLASKTPRSAPTKAETSVDSVKAVEKRDLAPLRASNSSQEFQPISKNATSMPFITNRDATVIISPDLSRVEVEQNSTSTSRGPIRSQIMTSLGKLRKERNKWHQMGFLCSDSIYYDRTRKPAAKAFQWTAKETTLLELHMARLALCLLLKASELPGPDFLRSMNAISPQDLMNAVKDIDLRLQEAYALSTNHNFMNEKLNFPRYAQFLSQEERSHPTHSPLNKILLNIFGQLAASRISVKEALHRIGYYLMISTVAPDTVTLTILITKLSAMDQHQIVSLVIEALKKSGLHQNEITVCAILCHYIRSRDEKNFAINSRMNNGLLGGQTPARPGRENTPGLRRNRRARVVQLIKPDNHIYAELIRGNLIFGKLSKALSILDYMHWVGDSPEARHYALILRTCAIRSQKLTCPTKHESKFEKLTSRSYLQLGLEMWKAINALHKQDPHLGSIDTSTISYLLCLFKLHGEQDLFKSVYKNALCEGHEMDLLIVPSRADVMECRFRKLVETVQRQRRVLERRLSSVVSVVSDISMRLAASLVILTAEDHRSAQDAFEAVTTARVAYPKDYFVKLWRPLEAGGKMKPGEPPPLFRVDFGHDAVRQSKGI